MENLPPASDRPDPLPESLWFQRILDRLTRNLERDAVVQQTTQRLQTQLKADRVVLYYFFRRWKGQVVAEALRDEALSILGSTGADDCFNATYAELYRDGRYRAIADVLTEPIHDCHRDFLLSIQVRANLAVPVLVAQDLWGLLIAHHCQAPHSWTTADIEQMQQGATSLAAAPCLKPLEGLG